MIQLLKIITILILVSCGKSEVKDENDNEPEIRNEKPAPKYYSRNSKMPYPQHVQYNSGVILPDVNQSVMDNKVLSYYYGWKNNYIRTMHDTLKYVLYTTEQRADNAVTVSEAHGYGMIITALMAGADNDAYDTFVRMYNYYKQHPSEITPELMAWQQNSSGEDIDGPDSATDGDIDIAYSLLLADKQWGSDGEINFLQEAKNMINAILKADINPVTKTIRLGDWATSGKYNKSTRCSDFILQQLRSFKDATQNALWDQVIDTTYNVIEAVEGENTGLLPDFVVIENGKYKPAPANFLESDKDGHYYYNSCRVPWRIASDFIIGGDIRSKRWSDKINNWVENASGSNPWGIMGGYYLNGTSFREWTDMEFIAPFGVSAMVDAKNQEWLNKLWGAIISDPVSSDAYFGDTIKMICIIIMSGNYWVP